MDIDKFKKRLSRYLKGRSNETENALIEAWYKSYETKEQPLTEDEVQRIGRAIRDRISAATARPRVIRLPVVRIAASLFIAGSLSWLAWHFLHREKPDNSEYSTITTRTNEVKQVMLADNSVIWLNADSRLQVPLLFKGHLREVKLLEGEAFFDVKRDPQHPFIVHINDLNVHVLGTSFNIRAYTALSTINVAVATGKVGVTKRSHLLKMLLPGQMLSYNTRLLKYQQESIDISQVQSWKTGYTYLNQAKFEELALVIKNTYGLILQAGNSKVSAYRFSLRVQHNLPSDQILKVISQIHNTHYRKEGNKVILY